MFDNGKKHGVGKLRYVNGNTYEGEFVNDKKHGFGRYESVTENYVYEGADLIT